MRILTDASLDHALEKIQGRTGPPITQSRAPARRDTTLTRRVAAAWSRDDAIAATRSRATRGPLARPRRRRRGSAGFAEKPCVSGSVCGGSLGQARALGGRGKRRRGPAGRIERRAARTATPSSRRPGPSAAAARGPEPPERRPKAHRRRRRDARSPTTAPHHRPRRGPNPLEIA